MVEPSQLEDSVEIFCSYSHQDEPLRREFESSVAVLRRQKLVQVWHDRQISPGASWADKIDEHLNSADIITLFVSADFLESDYCYEKELSRALEREKLNQALVVPIIVRPCDWSDAPFAHLQVIPAGAKAVTSWTNRDEAWTSVAKSLKSSVRDVLTRKLEELKIKQLFAETSKRLQETWDPTEEELMKASKRLQEIWDERGGEMMKNVLASYARDTTRRNEEQKRIADGLALKIFALDEELGSNPKT